MLHHERTLGVGLHRIVPLPQAVVGGAQARVALHSAMWQHSALHVQANVHPAIIATHGASPAQLLPCMPHQHNVCCLFTQASC